MIGYPERRMGPIELESAGWLAVLLLALSLWGPAVGAVSAQSYDLIIRNGRVLDGTGNPWFHADVAVSGDRIVAVGRLGNATAARIIDARGMYVAPGFIDVHSHAASGLVRRELSGARPILAQGVTTVFVNPDGGGAVDLLRQRAALEEHGLGVNVAQLVAHGSIRQAVLGMDDRAPSPEELKRMRALVQAGMEAGAFGMSSGPYYAPGSYASTEELIELARVVADYDGIYTSHIRDEADFNIGVVAATDEVIRIAREARLPGIVTHIKVLGPRVWGYSAALVSRIERAREEGVEVFADQYPYAASGTGLVGALVPPWAQAGGDTALSRRMDDRAERARLRAGIVDNLDRRGGAERIQFRRHAADPSVEGRTLHDIALERSMHPADLAMELLRAGPASIVSFNMHEADVGRLMRQPWTMTSSDGELVPMGEGVPHPRSYGTFPRKLRVYVQERGVIGLEQAIHSMTHLPATVHRLRDRGIVREGAVADLVVFDLARVNDPANFREPHQLSEGMVHVLVNGQAAIDAGVLTDALHGRVLSRRATQNMNNP
ncbi:amidohydrolase family protein [soil metagenome]